MSFEQRLVDIARECVNVFTKTRDGACVSCGSNTRSVRETEGLAADSVVIDCAKTAVRIGVMVRDDDPSEFGIIVGKKGAPENEAQCYVLPIKELASSTILRHMEENFAK